MKNLIYAVAFLTALLIGCSDDSTVNNKNNNPSNVIFSRFGLVDSIYNESGNQQFSLNTLDTIQFTNYNNIRIKIKLNGAGSFNLMALYIIPCDTCSNENFFEKNADTLMNIDTTIQSPQEDGVFGVFLYSNQQYEWISIRDLVLEKVD